jgi:ubiquinone/menaquinone biosynthesis C-methylase UbiE
MPAGRIDMDQAKTEQFLGRALEDIGAAARIALCYVGDKLGIFRAMAASGAVTVDELARKTELDARYLREWLGTMATADYVTYDAASGKYLLPPEHALPLADESFPFFIGGFMQLTVPLISVAPKVAEHFKTGKGVTQAEYPQEVWEGMERASMPAYKHKLVQEWIAAMPEVKRKLEAGGTAIDVGCGSGRAAITIARAFPKATVHGYDQHEGSIERARANARQAGVADRVHFTVADGAKLPARRFDFIATFDVVHDAVDPVGLLQSIKAALAPGGTYLMMEMNASGDVQHNVNPIGRMLYPISTLYCLTTSRRTAAWGSARAWASPRRASWRGRPASAASRSCPSKIPSRCSTSSAPEPRSYVGARRISLEIRSDGAVFSS